VSGAMAVDTSLAHVAYIIIRHSHNSQVSLLFSSAVLANPPGSHIADHFNRMMRHIACEHNDFNITVHWLPGHSDVHGNEEADKHAKLVSEGHHNNSQTNHLSRYLCHHSLPLSISALIEQQGKDTADHWKHLWHSSPNYHHTNHIDPKILHLSYPIYSHFSSEVPDIRSDQIRSTDPYWIHYDKLLH
jgi:hypothetical protein